MGNSLTTNFFYLQCFHCNHVYRNMEQTMCSCCNKNILVSNTIDLCSVYTLNNYKKKIAILEEMCMTTKCRIQSGYNYLQQTALSKKIRITFRHPVELSLEKPCEDIRYWDNNLRLNFLNYIVEFYNSLVSINYSLYEAILCNSLQDNIYRNFKWTHIDRLPTYDELFDYNENYV